MMFNINNLAYFTEGTKLIKTEKKSQETGGQPALSAQKMLPRYQKPWAYTPPIEPFHYQTDEQSSGVVT